MSQWLIYLVAIVAAIVITAPIALVLYTSMQAKNIALSYFVEKTLALPEPPPIPPGLGCTKEESEAYWQASAAWNKRWAAYNAKYPS